MLEQIILGLCKVFLSAACIYHNTPFVIHTHFWIRTNGETTYRVRLRNFFFFYPVLSLNKPFFLSNRCWPELSTHTYALGFVHNICLEWLKMNETNFIVVLSGTSCCIHVTNLCIVTENTSNFHYLFFAPMVRVKNPWIFFFLRFV